MNLKDANELKGLTSQLTKLESEKSTILTDVNFKQKELGRYKSRISDLRVKINNINARAQKQGDLVISEHAIIRYIQNVLGIDIETINEKIKVDVLKSYKNMGDGLYPLEDGCKARIKNGNVVTIIEKD